MNKNRSAKVIRLHRDKADTSKQRYASVDKPYNRFYETYEQLPIPEKTIYQTVYDNNADNPSGIALRFGSEEITFEQFFQEVDSLANALVYIGVNTNDIVSAALSSTPEAVYLLYATSKVGATLASIDPRDSLNELQQKLRDANPRCVFIAEGFPLEDGVIASGAVDTMVVLGAEAEEVKAGIRRIPFDSIKAISSDVLIKAAPYSENHAAAIVYTGASTGNAKGVMLSDKSFNAMGTAWENSGYKFRLGKTFLNVLPQFIAYGVCNALHAPLMWGETVVLADPFHIELFPDILLATKPNHVFCSPVHIRLLKANEHAVSADLSFLELVASGGAGMPAEEDENNYLWFAHHGADGSYGQGYGLTEVNAAFCYGTGRKNKIGYIGIPFSGNDAVIVDVETLQELPYGEGLEGLLMIKTPMSMLGYFGSSAYRDADVFVEDEAGETWISTQDICVMDESGKIKIIDRVGRGFNCFGMNVYPAVMENVFATHPAVKESIVVGIPHEDLGMAPVVNVVVSKDLLSEAESLADELDEIVKRELPSYTIVYAYNFRVDLPYTTRGKPDYQTIQAQGICDLGNNVIVARKVAALNEVIGQR